MSLRQFVTRVITRTITISRIKIAAMPRTVAMIMLRKIDPSERASEISFIATRMKANPIIPRMKPTRGTSESSKRIEPVPPRIFACERREDNSILMQI